VDFAKYKNIICGNIEIKIFSKFSFLFQELSYCFTFIFLPFYLEVLKDILYISNVFAKINKPLLSE